MNLHRLYAPLATGLLLAFASSTHAAPAGATPDGVAFAHRMHEVMSRMDSDMRAAPMSGSAEHDFVTMMIPHHQAAIDMSAALLAQTKDPELRNLAQSIVTEQATEIALMRAWLKRHAPACKTEPTCRTP